ncbi:hypothetical protein BD0120_01000 [Helicobacter pylori]|uniref:transcriptional regulator n=1 Tax=Helicobacter pylori TaxID=210 RepID=UPI003599875F
MGTFIEKWFSFYQIREELEARISGLENSNNQLRQKNDKLFTTKERLTKENTDLTNKNNELFKENENLSVKISGLENSNDQLLQAKENIAEEKAELEREIAHLKSLEATDKSDLDLQNRRFKSTIEDLKRQNKKLEEENMALKERVDSLKEQLSKQPKPQ